MSNITRLLWILQEKNNLIDRMNIKEFMKKWIKDYK